MVAKKKTIIQLLVNENSADLYIYGDITSDAELLNWWYETDAFVSANNLVKTIQDLNVKDINVFINSYGGEVAEALAIYSALKRHEAKVHTYCDGFACSAATIIFCAGDDRVMGDLALMMIHNASMCVGYATADEMRKAAEDIDKITQASVKAYLAVSTLSEDEIHDMMDKETWISAEEALEWGFATEIAEQDPEEEEDPQQSTLRLIREALLRPEPVHVAESDLVMDAVNAIAEELREVREDLKALKVTEKDPDPVDEPAKVNEKASKFFSFLK